MNVRYISNILLLITGVLLGVLLSYAAGTIQYFNDPGWTSLPEGVYEHPENPVTGMVVGIAGVPERPSPKDRISENNILVYNDRVIIDVKNPEWATFTDTNSMDPVLDKGANAIEIKPESPDDIEVGDIISYHSEYADGTFIHRVVYKGHDERGVYFIAKGDNLPTSDPGKIRFSQIERVVVAIIY